MPTDRPACARIGKWAARIRQVIVVSILDSASLMQEIYWVHSGATLTSHISPLPPSLENL